MRARCGVVVAEQRELPSGARVRPPPLPLEVSAPAAEALRESSWSPAGFQYSIPLSGSFECRREPVLFAELIHAV